MTIGFMHYLFASSISVQNAMGHFKDHKDSIGSHRDSHESLHRLLEATLYAQLHTYDLFMTMIG